MKIAEALNSGLVKTAEYGARFVDDTGNVMLTRYVGGLPMGHKELEKNTAEDFRYAYSKIFDGTRGPGAVTQGQQLMQNYFLEGGVL